MSDQRLKQIRIKTGVVKRLAKEKVMYVKEAEKEKGKLEKMRAADGDSYDLRKQEEIIRETLMMVPDSHKRFQSAYNELKDILESEAELEESEEYQTAVSVLKEIDDTASSS